MKKTSMIGEMLNIIGVLVIVCGGVVAVYAATEGQVASAIYACLGTLFMAVLLFGAAEILNAVVRTAAACEEIAKQQRELRRASS